MTRPTASPSTSITRGVAGDEIALLVEHRVVRKVLLAIGGGDAAVAQHRERVVAPAAVALGKADEDNTRANLRGERRELAGAGVEERRAQQQVFRRVAAQRELGCGHQRRAGALALARGRQDRPRIAFEVADRLIELGDRDVHAENGSTRSRASRGVITSP
jgi:hypothetical protein